LINEVFYSEVEMDLSSLGGKKEKMSSTKVCEMWEEQLKELEAIHHLSGNYLINLTSDNRAKVLAHSITTQFKEDTVEGKTRQYYGTYDLEMQKSEDGWRIKSFKYILNFINSNIEME